MALTYIETVRLLMGDLDEGDNNFFSADQWAHLFGIWSYDDDQGDSKVSIVEVAQAALAILCRLPLQQRRRRAKADKLTDRRDELGSWHDDIKASVHRRRRTRRHRHRRRLPGANGIAGE